jgi:hypothetical protein
MKPTTQTRGQLNQIGSGSRAKGWAGSTASAKTLLGGTRRTCRHSSVRASRACAGEDLEKIRTDESEGLLANLATQRARLLLAQDAAMEAEQFGIVDRCGQDQISRIGGCAAPVSLALKVLST